VVQNLGLICSAHGLVDCALVIDPRSAFRRSDRDAHRKRSRCNVLSEDKRGDSVKPMVKLLSLPCKTRNHPDARAGPSGLSVDVGIGWRYVIESYATWHRSIIYETGVQYYILRASSSGEFQVVSCGRSSPQGQPFICDKD